MFWGFIQSSIMKFEKFTWRKLIRFLMLSIFYGIQRLIKYQKLLEGIGYVRYFSVWTALCHFISESPSYCITFSFRNVTFWRFFHLCDIRNFMIKTDRALVVCTPWGQMQIVLCNQTLSSYSIWAVERRITVYSKELGWILFYVSSADLWLCRDG